MPGAKHLLGTVMLPVAIRPANITVQAFVLRRHLQVAILPTTTATATPAILPMMI
jgi:hypothetical protein